MADTTTYPYDTIVEITDTIGGEEYQASGVLISPDEVLTASHVVYMQGVGTASNIVVAPGYNDGIAPFGYAYGISFYYFPIDNAGDEESPSASQSDYAVIHLASSFPTLGTLGLLANYAGGAVTVAGYPASANGALVVSNQTVSDNPRYTLLDGTALGPGSSGGPVFVGGASDPQVVGLVSTGDATTGQGYDVQITTQALDQIEQWVESDDDPAPVASPPPATPPDASVSVSGTQAQYVIANSGGDLY
jgi:V8-like Glu-specific endopeptidase